MNMQSFQFTSQINREGILTLQLPSDLANQEVDIMLVVHFKPQPTQPERPIGQYAGKMRMSEDFSEPLPDEFWLGEMP
ncbi:MAG: hypothetical protein BWK80_37890 [Desulfobacteraceae bacterium IS3]|nr:MAG: hypothetical protein BWK80_37890 [Desulfobacteraceae bacterium IS3]